MHKSQKICSPYLTELKFDIDAFNTISRYLKLLLNTCNPYFGQMVSQIDPTDGHSNNHCFFFKHFTTDSFCNNIRKCLTDKLLKQGYKCRIYTLFGEIA